MKVSLRKMDDAEFDAFVACSISDYAKDLRKEQELTEEEALRQAEAEFTSLLPAGQDSENHFLCVIWDEEADKKVGWIWFFYQAEENTRQAYLADLLIDEGERRKGYADAALDAMERQVAADGCAESALYVWDHNPAGLALYRKRGYMAVQEEQAGRYMKKRLTTEERRGDE